jgi:hypothetical protein
MGSRTNFVTSTNDEAGHSARLFQYLDYLQRAKKRALRICETPFFSDNSVELVSRIPFVDFLLGGFFGLAVFLLDKANKLLAATFSFIKLVIGHFATFLAGLTFDLLPVAFDFIPIHGVTFLFRYRKETPTQRHTFQKLFDQRDGTTTHEPRCSRYRE